jgi:hypothetical protein
MSDPLYDLMSKGRKEVPFVEKLEQATGSTPSGPVKTSAEATSPLNVIDENASKCCKRQLAAIFPTVPASTSGEVITHCASCGTEFRASMEGPVRVWRIVEHFAVHRR